MHSMRFGVRNAYYLRISASIVLPLYLYLDERHIDWMSERILQHVLEDLRPRILAKLTDEADAHLGQGGPANAKRSVVDVHRGETYQFGYFLRKTDPHSVLIKTRRFVAAPPPRPPEEVPPPLARTPSPEPSVRKRRKRVPKKAGVPSTGGKRRKTKGKGKQKAQEIEDEDDAISISSDEEDDLPLHSAPPRRSTRAKKPVADGYKDQDEDLAPDEEEFEEGPSGHPPNTIEADVNMMDGEEQVAQLQFAPDVLSLDDTNLITIGENDAVTTVSVKREDAEPALGDDVPSIIHEPLPDDPDVMDTAIPANAAVPELHLDLEDSEDKPKPVLRLEYQGFNLQGRCLCVIVEPWPPIRGATRAPSLALSERATTRAPSIAPPDFVPSGGAAQRERTPLFLPEYGRERSVTPAPFATHAQRSLPPVPLFHEDSPDNSDSDDDGLMQFSQILQSVGEHQAGAVGDDDEIDGAVFFGDADEIREL